MRQAGKQAGRQSCVRESEMAPRTARETKRVWSINVKREEGGGFWLLNCKGGHQHTYGSATAFGHWSRSHRRTLPCGASQPASVPWGSDRSSGDVDPDGVVIQSSIFRSIQNNQA